MVAAGVREIGSGGLDGLRARRPGGGRVRVEEMDGGLGPGWGGLAEAAMRGDPVAEVSWCSLSLREIARLLAGLGFGCGKDAVARMMRGEGCRLRGMSRWKRQAPRPAGGEPGSAVSPWSIGPPLPEPWWFGV